MQSWLAWVQRPSGVIEKRGKLKQFKSKECYMEVNIDNQTESLPYTPKAQIHTKNQSE